MFTFHRKRSFASTLPAVTTLIVFVSNARIGTSGVAGCHRLERVSEPVESLNPTFWSDSRLGPSILTTRRHTTDVRSWKWLPAIASGRTLNPLTCRQYSRSAGENVNGYNVIWIVSSCRIARTLCVLISRSSIAQLDACTKSDAAKRVVHKVLMTDSESILFARVHAEFWPFDIK